MITSLRSLKETLYVGTHGGVILVLDLNSFAVVHLLHAYNGPVQCLLADDQAKYVKRLSRIHARRDSFPSSSSLYTESCSWSSSMFQGSPEGNVVLSLGTGYRGVVGDSSNHPATFNMPSDSVGACPHCRGSLLATCCCDSSQSRRAKPDPAVGCLLYWSNSEQVPISEDSHRFSVASVSTISTVPELVESAST